MEGQAAEVYNKKIAELRDGLEPRQQHQSQLGGILPGTAGVGRGKRRPRNPPPSVASAYKDVSESEEESTYGGKSDCTENCDPDRGPFLFPVNRRMKLIDWSAVRRAEEHHERNRAPKKVGNVLNYHYLKFLILRCT